MTFNVCFHCSINQTDQMLVHLQSFNSIPEHYTIPESTKNGVPLFYIPPGSTTPVRAVISLIHYLSSAYHGVLSSLFQHVMWGHYSVDLIKNLRRAEKHPRVKHKSSHFVSQLLDTSQCIYSAPELLEPILEPFHTFPPQNNQFLGHKINLGRKKVNQPTSGKAGFF